MPPALPYHVDVGDGPLVVVLHGAYSTHEELRPFVDSALPDRRRIYVDLPGMGSSQAEQIRSTADVVIAVESLLDTVIGAEPYLLLGHSYGAHVARGLARRHPAQVTGMALLCPWVPDADAPLTLDTGLPPPDHGTAELTAPLATEEREAFLDYFVVRTPLTLQRFRNAVAPTIGRYDHATVDRMMTNWQFGPGDPAAFDGPVLLVAGREDSLVGWKQIVPLTDHYPRATAVVLAGAGHALPHERPAELANALTSWLASTARWNDGRPRRHRIG